MIIDCDGCRARGPACQDCVVTVLLGSVPGDHADVDRVPAPVLVSGATLPVRGVGTVELDAAEQAAIAVLAGSGLVPPLRVVPGGRVDDAASPHRHGRGPRASAG